MVALVRVASRSVGARGGKVPRRWRWRSCPCCGPMLWVWRQQSRSRIGGAVRRKSKRGRITPFIPRKRKLSPHVAPHGGRAAPLAAGARLIAAPTPRRRHLTRRGASRRRRQNRRELAARPRQQKHQPSTSPSLLVSSRLVAGAHARDVRTCRRVRSAKDDSNREPVGAAAARGGKTHDAHLMEMLRLWHLLI